MAAVEAEERTALVRDAVAAWRRASALSVHGPGCGCGGGRAIRFNQTWLAEDIDHALRTRYARAGQDGLTALLEAHPVREGEDFAVRLAALAAPPTDLATVVGLLRDITEILGSIGARSCA